MLVARWSFKPQSEYRALFQLTAVMCVWFLIMTTLNLNLGATINSVMSVPDLLSSSLMLLTLSLTAVSWWVYTTLPMSAFSKTSLSLFLGLSLGISFSTSSVILFYIAFESSLIPIMILILFFGSQPERINATTYFLAYTSIISLPYLALLSSMSSETLDLMCISHDIFISKWWSIILMSPFLVKLPVYGLHLWLPKAHVEAPVVGSMLLAGLLLKLGSFGLLRFCLLLPNSLEEAKNLGGLFLLGGVLSAIVCSLQSDVKKMVAYSSVCHMTLLLPAVLSQLEISWFFVVFSSFSHGAISSGLFYGSYITSNKPQTRLLIYQQGGLWFWPSLGFLFFLLLAMNMATPPTGGFVAEIALASAILHSSPINIISWVGLSFWICYYNAFLYTTWNHHKSLHNSVPNSSMWSYWITAWHVELGLLTIMLLMVS